MSWRLIRSTSRRFDSSAIAKHFRASSLPSCAAILSCPEENPVQICPPLRPDAPWPTVSASSTTTLWPASASSSAAESPVNPAPTMHTSAEISPASGG